MKQPVPRLWVAREWGIQDGHASGPWQEETNHFCGYPKWEPQHAE